jgi:hypothetical protein
MTMMRFPFSRDALGCAARLNEAFTRLAATR